MKSRPRAKMDNFVFKNSNIIIEGLILKTKDYFPWKKFKSRKIMYLTNFYSYGTFFLIASYKIVQNYAILINHESFF